MSHATKERYKLSLLSSIEQTYPITILSDESDKKPKEIHLTQKQIFDLFKEHLISDSKSTLAYVPGCFSKQMSRADVDVKQISMLVYDIDCTSVMYSLESLKNKLKNYTSIIHSTYSASWEHPKWRVIILLEQSIDHAQFKNVYLNVAKHLDIEFDLKCTNINRLFYFPSVDIHNDFRQRHINKAKLLNVKPFYGVPAQVKDNRSNSINYNIKPKLKRVNTGYVSFSSVENHTGSICGYSIPKPLKAPFSQSDFDNLLLNPGVWLQAAKYLGLPLDGITQNKSFSKSFCSILPGVTDNKPSCSLALLTSNDRPRVVYQAFNEEHESSGRSGPVIIDLARVYAMLFSGRRIEQSEFPAATHKVWLTRLLMASGAIIPEPIKDLPPLPTEIQFSNRLYEGFKDLLRCKRAFIEQKHDATAFSLTFACYWCKIGNRNTVKKYTQALLNAEVLRFVDKLTLPRGVIIPLMMPAGKTAKIYKLKQRDIKNKVKRIESSANKKFIGRQEGNLGRVNTKNNGHKDSPVKNDGNCFDLTSKFGRSPSFSELLGVRERGKKPVYLDVLLNECSFSFDNVLFSIVNNSNCMDTNEAPEIPKLMKYRE